MTEFSSQAGLSSFRGTPPPAPVTIYAAVIEWPSYFADADPSLILARSEADRDKQIAREILGMANAPADATWRDLLTGVPMDWSQQMDALEDAAHVPTITLYEQEV